jgi:hypothetical protein
MRCTVFGILATLGILRAQDGSVLLPGDPNKYQPLPPVGCDAYNLQYMTILSLQQKTCIWAGNLTTMTALFGAGVSAGIAQYTKSPPEWPQGVDGYSRRFGTAYAQSMAKSTGEFLTGLLTHSDPREAPPDNPVCGHSHRTASLGVAKRIGMALEASVWEHRENCSDGVAWSHFAGSFSSGFLGMLWTPDRENTVPAAMGRTGTAFAGYVGGSLFREFEPDLVKFAGRIFGRTSPKKAKVP